MLLNCTECSLSKSNNINFFISLRTITNPCNCKWVCNSDHSRSALLFYGVTLWFVGYDTELWLKYSRRKRYTSKLRELLKQHTGFLKVCFAQVYFCVYMCVSIIYFISFFKYRFIHVINILVLDIIGWVVNFL